MEHRQQDIRDAADRAEEHVRAATDVGSDAADDLRRRAERGFHDARDRLHRMDSETRQATHHAMDTADEYVGAHPWRAVAVAAAVGALAGALFLSRRS